MAAVSTSINWTVSYTSKNMMVMVLLGMDLLGNTVARVCSDLQIRSLDIEARINSMFKVK